MQLFKHDHCEVLYNTLLNWRQTAGLTQLEVARAVGVSRQTIIAIENGDSIPSVLLALKIAHCFGAQVEDIFGYERV